MLRQTRNSQGLKDCDASVRARGRKSERENDMQTLSFQQSANGQPLWCQALGVVCAGRSLWWPGEGGDVSVDFPETLNCNTLAGLHKPASKLGGRPSASERAVGHMAPTSVQECQSLFPQEEEKGEGHEAAG